MREPFDLDQTKARQAAAREQAALDYANPDTTDHIFGSVDQLPSGRYRAMYYGPDGRRHKAPTTFLAKADARAWLSLRQSEIISKAWMPPDAVKAPKTTFAEYADQWLANRTVGGRPLKPRTVEHYQKLLDEHITATFGALPIASITTDDVREWYAKLRATLRAQATAKAEAKARRDNAKRAAPVKHDGATLAAHAYGLLRTVLATAVSDGKIATNPAAIRGAGTAKRVHKVQPATVAQIGTIADAMPARWSLMVLLAGWLALRFGELTELRRKDVDLAAEVVRVRRAVVRTDDGFQVTTPKSDAGIRDIAIPPHLIPAIEAHLSEHVGAKADSLLFPAVGGGHLAPATLYRRFYTARAAAGRDDLRWHDLRHSGAVLAAATGATLAELMARLGHSTPAAAMRYQHAAQGRDRQIAALLSKGRTPKGCLSMRETSEAPRRRYAKLAAAAEYIGVTDRTIRQMIADGRLTGYRSGSRLVRVDLNELDAAMKPFGGAA